MNRCSGSAVTSLCRSLGATVSQQLSIQVRPVLLAVDGDAPVGMLPDEVVVDNRGGVDLATGPEFRQELGWASSVSVSERELGFELWTLAFCDPTGLDARCAPQRRVYAQGRTVRSAGQSSCPAWRRSMFPPHSVRRERADPAQKTLTRAAVQPLRGARRP